MTDYSDVPEINTLYQQREIVTQAQTILADPTGGVTHMTIAPASTVVGPPGSPTPLMPVQVVVPLPNDATFLTEVQTWLTQRQADIDAQLATLGVTNTPIDGR